MNSPNTDKPVVVTLSAPEDGPPPGLEPLNAYAHIVHTSDRQGLLDAIADADVLLVTDFRTSLLQEAWPRAKKVQWVHATSAGVDAILFPALTESAVPVTNARGIFDNAIAEYVLGLILSFAKDFMGTFALQRERRWRHRDTERIQGRRALVVGAGSIGRAIARLLKATGLEVAGVARHHREDDPDFGTVHATEALHDLLADADYVVVAAPLTESTRGMFGAGQFACMKPTARFINIGRGPIVQTDALVAALRDGRPGGAALDVFEQEPLPPEHPLWQMPQVIVSAHMAGDFIGWRAALSAQFIDNFQRWRQGQALNNLVDKRRGYGPAHQE
ncbi:MAG TPA: D-2-hydroxyacid dehydrogenase [Gammaproteobacteria bacterium]|nr:D-2-hydroxyacid dehydrogenase [Gammaproteobacteria bacterium]